MTTIPDPRWFGALGAPFAVDAAAAARTLESRLPVFTGGAVERVTCAKDALRALRAIDAEATWWDTEENAREVLWDSAAERMGEDALARHMAEVNASIAARWQRSALSPVLVAQTALADPAREAALLVVHQFALATAAGATEHWLAAKYALFMAGHWVLGGHGGRLFVF